MKITIEKYKKKKSNKYNQELNFGKNINSIYKGINNNFSKDIKITSTKMIISGLNKKICQTNFIGR